MKKRIICLVLCLTMLLSMATLFTACGDEGDGSSSSRPDALVIMTDNLDGLFNPFFSTAAADGTIVGMTQIGMLTSTYENGVIGIGYGENEAVVTLDFMQSRDEAKDETTYTFVLKNGIQYSDGHPLTMEDVLFNLYVYLDPVYTGSTTMYSTKIVGLSEYRTQSITPSDDDDDLISQDANSRADARLLELINLFRRVGSEGQTQGVYYADFSMMEEAIFSKSVSSGYKNAVATPAEQNSLDQSFYQNLLFEDYKHALELFKKELNSDYDAAKDSYADSSPYKEKEEFKDEVFCFMFTEGYVVPKYAKGPDGKDDKNNIESFEINYNQDVCTDKASAVNFVYEDKIASQLDQILTYWATAQTLRTEFIAKATEVILHQNISSDGDLLVPNIEGIKSLGHIDSYKGQTITVNGNEYTIASGHNSDGTVSNANEYDVLQITIEGVDPKAHWNFAFTVAPQHYYGEGSKVGVDIENNKFGVEYSSFDFMKDVVQSPRNIKLPMGAGAYKVTDRDNSDNPDGSNFFKNNIVYFKANNNFHTVGTGINNPKIDKIRYQVVSSNNAIGALQNGSVHYITPQLTDDNLDQLDALKSKGITYLSSKQLGYGYIGVNASKIPDINIRKAIMCAMNTALAIQYYRPGTADQIYWPMSQVSWAHPKDEAGNYLKDNGLDYPQIGLWDKELAKANIQKYMQEAGVSAGDKSLDITFTIAGSNLQEHPTYATFRDAAALLNELGWEVDVKPDTQALTKLSTGSLEVWAAAWGSTIDPDLYQVYHKNSTATSTLAWGYPSIKASGSAEEKEILNDLSDLIDEARETLDQDERTRLYKEAMTLILDLAIELPVYQRSQLYAFNTDVLNASSMPSQSEMNPYTSPLDRIWELEFAN